MFHFFLISACLHQLSLPPVYPPSLSRSTFPFIPPSLSYSPLFFYPLSLTHSLFLPPLTHSLSLPLPPLFHSPFLSLSHLSFVFVSRTFPLSFNLILSFFHSLKLRCHPSDADTAALGGHQRDDLALRGREGQQGMA